MLLNPPGMQMTPPLNTISFLLLYKLNTAVNGRTNWIEMNLFLRFYSTNYLLNKANVSFSQQEYKQQHPLSLIKYR